MGHLEFFVLFDWIENNNHMDVFKICVSIIDQSILIM